MLVVDLGQSGSRVRIDGQEIISERGKLNGEAVIDALEVIFLQLDTFKTDTVALACTGFNGIVSDPQPFLTMCSKFFGATKVAVIDDGLAGFVGALGGSTGVVLSIGGGVVSVGGREGKFAHRDGLGSTFGDEGGGFWLGKLGITKALGIRQGRGNDQILLDVFADQVTAFDALDVKNGAEAATLAIHSAKKLFEAADAGSPMAIAIRDEGAALLAQTVIATWIGAGGSTSDSPEIAIQGGPSKNQKYVDTIKTVIAATLPNVKFIAARGDNLDGGQWIAENMLTDAAPLLRWATN
ncbi:unannotated protein [freshwater metagenome]|uniref:Unannotated protein n=1 Tax=freshwater metagenome TaxID=449393 RepID=A0A6J6BE99_9ZZZZ